MSYRFSVLIPLEFHRGQELDCLRRWTHEQTFPRDSYEVLAIGCPTSLSAERMTAIRGLLGRNDRLLLHEEAHDIALCAYGAGQATGELLFFTEAHVLPEADTLALSDQAVRLRPEVAGLSGRSRRITHNRFSRAEADMYEEDIRYGMEEHAWRKINDQCFFVRREPYMQAGGFCGEYGHYAEWLLSARMFSLGHMITYAPEVTVQHYYIGNADVLIEFASDFASGEMRYQHMCGEDTCRELLGTIPQWDERLQRRLDLALFVWVMIFRQCLKRGDSAERAGGGRWSDILMSATRRLFASFTLLAAQLHLLNQRLLLGLRLQLSGDQKKHLQVVRQLNQAVVLLERQRFVADWLRSQPAHVGPSGDNACLPFTWAPESARDVPAIGIHDLEHWQDSPFRWSEPAAVIEVYLEAGLYQVVLEWLNIRKITDIEVRINRHLLHTVCNGCRATAEFRAVRSGAVRLAWLCQPFYAEGDDRLLGLPLQRISCVRSS